MSTSSASVDTASRSRHAESAQLFAGQRGRALKENLTAYLFILPATIIIFVFGIFPVGFALYVSLFKWQLQQGDYKGLGNYTKAIDSFAYVGAFWLAIGALIFAVVMLRRVLRVARENDENPLLWLLPAGLVTGGALLFVRFVVLWLPELLGVGDKLRRTERTQAIVMELFGDTFQVPAVAEAMWLSIVALVIGVAVTWVVYREWPSTHSGAYFINITIMLLMATIGVLVLGFTFSQVQAAYNTALEEGTELDLWTQIVTISAGFVLLGVAWLVWRQAHRQPSMLRYMIIIAAAAALIAGGWILIGEIPKVIELGDEKLFEGFRNTVFYSAGTVPFQLVISLFLAYLLFQDIGGKAFLRMVYFLPYITPAVASAAVFRILFTNRPEGIMNRVIGAFGVEPQRWIQESTGIFEPLADSVANFLQNTFSITMAEWVHGWLAGPSLALLVIIIYSIWTFVGYDTVVFLAGLGAIPGEMYEAAKVDGAGRWSVFRHITLPLLSPTTFFLSLIAIIGTFKAFNHIWVLRDTGALGTTDTASVVIFNRILDRWDMGYASAMAFVLFGVILALTVAQNRIAGRRVFYG